MKTSISRNIFDKRETNALRKDVPVILMVPAIIKAIKGKKVSLVDLDGNTYLVDPKYLQFVPAGYPFKVGQKKEHIKLYDVHHSDSWECICGNVAESGGFYPCDAQGNEIEPLVDSGFNDLSICGACGRIIDENTLEVVGQNANPKYLVFDR